MELVLYVVLVLLFFGVFKFYVMFRGFLNDLLEIHEVVVGKIDKIASVLMDMPSDIKRTCKEKSENTKGFHGSKR